MVNLGGEKENGALVTAAVAVLEAGREKENAGLEAPKEKLGALAGVETIDVGVVKTDVDAGVEAVDALVTIGEKLNAGAAGAVSVA